MALLGACYDLDGLPRADLAGDLADAGADLPDADVPSLRLLAGALGGGGNEDGLRTAASFYFPAAVAAAPDGTLYVMDAGNHVIRALRPGGAVELVAGNMLEAGSAPGVGAAARFDHPCAGVVLGQALYVVDDNAHTLSKIELDTRMVTILAGQRYLPGAAAGLGADARFNGPSGITTDGSTLFVTDRHGNIIRSVTLDGYADTFAGTGVFGVTDGPAGVASFGTPLAITHDNGGTLYIGEVGSTYIRRLVIATRETTKVAFTQMPNGLAFVAPYLYVADPVLQTISRIAPATGAVATFAGVPNARGSADGMGGTALFDTPLGLAASGGALYVADSRNHAVRRIGVQDADVTTVAGSAGLRGIDEGKAADARFRSPEGVTVSEGLVYVADTFNHLIRVVTPAGFTTTLAGSGHEGSADGQGQDASFGAPTGIAADGAGKLYVADPLNQTVRVIALATSTVTTVAGTTAMAGALDGGAGLATFNEPRALAFDRTRQRLYIADSRNFVVRALDVTTATVSTLAGKAGIRGSTSGRGEIARFAFPCALAIDANDSHLYVADAENHTVREIDLATGDVRTLAGSAGKAGFDDGTSSAARFNMPRGLALDDTGALWVADTDSSTVRRIILADARVETPAGTPGRAHVVLGPLPALVNRPIGLAFLPGHGLVVTAPAENALLLLR